MFGEKTPEALAKKVRKHQDEAAFEVLVVRWQTEIYRKAMVAEMMDAKKAEKLTIDIFVDLWRKMSTGDYHEPVERWMRGQVDRTIVPIFSANKKAKT